MTKCLFLALVASLVISSQGLYSQRLPTELSEKAFADIVELPTLKRETGQRKYKVKVFGQEIDLDLHRNDDLLPTNLPVHVYGEDEEGNPTIDDWTHRTESFQKLYSNKKGASVMIEDVEGETKMSGTLGNGLIVEPIRDKELTEIVDNDFGEVKEVSRLRHVVYKLESNQTDDRDMFNQETEEKEDVEKRAILPKQLYVPIQVVVDYGLWKKMSKTEAEVIKYVKQFYNSVNQIFSSLSWPRVTISIYGIKICKTAQACKMIEDIKVDATSVDATKILLNIAKYAYEQKSATGINYAIMMVMTGYDLCVPQPDGSCEDGAVSTAPLGGACGKYTFGTTTKVGVMEDSGVFHHVRVAANNIGRLLGMMRDGERAGIDGVPADAEGPGAAGCRFTDHYVMGDTSHIGNQYTWSKCSVAQLRWFSTQPKASCLHVTPVDPIHKLISTLPGKEIGLDYQCQVLFGSDSAVQCRMPGVTRGNHEMCQSLTCKISSSECKTQGPPADGTYCGPQHHCYQGKCICDPNAPLPTALPKDPSCNGDHFWLLFNGKNCVEILSAAEGTGNCDHDVMKEHCCESRRKYCSPTPIACGELPPTVKPTPPSHIFTLAPTSTRRPFQDPSDVTCGKACEDNTQVRIDSKTCAQLLSSSADKTKLCDNPLVMRYCCRTRANVCRGYHWITNSCDNTCLDNPKTQINGKRCVEFLSTAEDRENFCHEPLTKQHCCATRWKVCPNETPFGK